MDDPYLIRKLEESSGYHAHSFSNRYMNWKRFYSISKSFGQELKKLKKLTRPISVLDIGCGDGWMIYRLKAKFDQELELNFTGIDISGFDIDFANKRKDYFSYNHCEFKMMDLNNLTFSNEEFDIVIISEVIEHIQNPGIIIESLSRVLKKNGLVILTTPQKGGSILAKLLRLLNQATGGLIKKCETKYEKKLLCDREKSLRRFSSEEGKMGSGLGHVSIKNLRQWKKIFRDHGFMVQAVRGTGGMLFGDPHFDRHRILFGLSVIFDVLTEPFSFFYSWSENFFFELRKK
jgi:ubiquinone/menaquinone biosynthesis C-methylase UbiE